MNNINQKDLAIVRDLAKQSMEIAQSDAMQKLKKEWFAHNTFKGERPMIVMELGTFAGSILPALQKCETDEMRDIEYSLLSGIVNHTLFGDDTVLNDFYPVPVGGWFIPFGLEARREPIPNSIGYHIVPHINDLEQDFHKLKKSAWGADAAWGHKRKSFLEEILGDIMPVRLTGSSIYGAPTYNLVALMSMETMFTSMYDYPELFTEMMNRMADDYLEYFDFLSREKLFLPTVGSEWLGQGTYCYTDELSAEVPTDRPMTSQDVWGFSDSQETVGVSADMFHEMIYPCYQKITSRYGLLSYGCCEPVHTFWEKSLSQLKNLRKISISPWCDETYMGERLAGQKIIYHRKPDPNFLGVDKDLNEEGLRAHFAKTLQAAKGCKIEFTTRDVYKVTSAQHVRRYVEILREEIEGNYR